MHTQLSQAHAHTALSQEATQLIHNAHLFAAHISHSSQSSQLTQFTQLTQTMLTQLTHTKLTQLTQLTHTKLTQIILTKLTQLAAHISQLAAHTHTAHTAHSSHSSQLTQLTSPACAIRSYMYAFLTKLAASMAICSTLQPSRHAQSTTGTQQPTRAGIDQCTIIHRQK